MKILVPVDFSTYSLHALDFAQKIGELMEVEITVLHVVQMPEEAADNTEIVDQLKNQAITRMHEMAILGKNVKTQVSIGQPFRIISQFASSPNADLLIIGESGQTDDEAFFIGSLADKLVRTSDCPVITINESIDLPLQRIVYASDLDDPDPELIVWIKKFQKLFNTDVHLVRINTRESFKNDQDSIPQLNEWKDNNELENCHVHVYNHDDKELGIVYFAEQINAGLICLGVQPRSAFQRIISGGESAKEVSDHTRRPVMTMKR